MIRLGRRAPMLQVAHDGIAHFLRQRHLGLLPVLAAHRYRGGSPVDVRQTQLHDITCSQAQPGQEQQDGAIALANRGLCIGAVKYPFDLLALPTLWLSSTTKRRNRATLSLFGSVPTSARRGCRYWR